MAVRLLWWLRFVAAVSLLHMWPTCTNTDFRLEEPAGTSAGNTMWGWLKICSFLAMFQCKYPLIYLPEMNFIHKLDLFLLISLQPCCRYFWFNMLRFENMLPAQLMTQRNLLTTITSQQHHFPETMSWLLFFIPVFIYLLLIQFYLL